MKIKKKTVDDFAKENINDERTIDEFIKYVEKKCGWDKEEVHIEGALKNVLIIFKKENIVSRTAKDLYAEIAK